MYSRVPKKVVFDTFEPSFFVVTLDEETEDDELASSAMVFSLARCDGGWIAKPKSHSFV